MHEAKAGTTYPSAGVHLDPLQHLDTVMDSIDPAEAMDNDHSFTLGGFMGVHSWLIFAHSEALQ